MADFLAYSDLVARVGDSVALRYFDDDGDGQLSSDETDVMTSVLNAAEAKAYSAMMGAWSKAQIILLAENDEYFKQQVAWVACELASERRTEFCAPDGSGAHMVQYNRALQHFSALKKNTARSAGESAAGRAATAGGNISPTPPADTACQYMFAPSKRSPTGHGSF